MFIPVKLHLIRFPLVLRFFWMSILTLNLSAILSTLVVYTCSECSHIITDRNHEQDKV